VDSGTYSAATRVMNTSRWLDREDVAPLQELAPDASELLWRAIADQNLIGWNKFFIGWIAKRWQAVFMQERNNTTAFEGREPASASWSKHIVNITFSFMLDMWYCRNDKEHEKDLMEPTTVKARLLAKIEWINLV
jgi:hypothetical protein